MNKKKTGIAKPLKSTKTSKARKSATSATSAGAKKSPVSKKATKSKQTATTTKYAGSSKARQATKSAKSSRARASASPGKVQPLQSAQASAVTKNPQEFISDYDVFLFKEGNHHTIFNKLGAHVAKVGSTSGVHFALWAPNAKSVSVIGDFNGWNHDAHYLVARADSSGIWEGFVPGLKKGTVYKYHVISDHDNFTVDKGDPYSFYWELAPRTASVVWDLDYTWKDDEWMQHRGRRNALDAPMSIYEMHPGSWQRVPEEENRSLTYRELAPRLANYCKQTGFTHVEFLPVMEHPFYGSWGYQTVGYFAPTSRYGTPQDFMFLVDFLHQHDIGVILDWVPSHFPSNENGLVYFDGTHLYEHADPRQGFHPDWKTYIFNYGRNEVRNFLISNALFWLDKYHVDGLRVDAVASMLYLDYSRKQGEWIPNKFGGRENLEAIEFLRAFNEIVYQRFPDVQTIAEESTSWPMVSRPIYLGGLGFGMKWNMGWMHDTLEYMSREPVHRKHHHNQLTFSQLYAYSENFVLPFSHDEVVYGKGSLLTRMPGDQWRKFANLRTLLGYMFAHPGKKMIFMGGEFGQRNEWNHDVSLDWHLLQEPGHTGLLRWVEDLNRLYKSEPSLYERDFESSGFEWIDCNDVINSVLLFSRKSAHQRDELVVAANFTPVPRIDYRIGVNQYGYWKEVLNSDAGIYGGGDMGNLGGSHTLPMGHHGRLRSIKVTLPPLSIVIFKHAAEA
ncbi:MAG: 1,4-alpha-glucan branching protein GlgB [Chitinivibrionales bacterium]|nr:1,4-alpha-glucan branching protein GlgB [Chitinivibrionales bacterium]